MSDYSVKTLSATFLDIVEQLTFMFGDPEEKEDLDLELEDFTQASMTFTGDMVGSLTVVVPTSITAEIAANILGLEPEDISDDAMLNDAVGEMLNVVCGHVIMTIAGKDANFALQAPQVSILAKDAVASLIDNPDFIGFTLDDHPVLLGLTTES